MRTGVTVEGNIGGNSGAGNTKDEESRVYSWV